MKVVFTSIDAEPCCKMECDCGEQFWVDPHTEENLSWNGEQLVPNCPKCNPAKEPEYQCKDIYLQKEGEKGFLGLHETGLKDGSNWTRMESWCNQYDNDKKFMYSAARIFGPIEEVAEDMKKDGYKVVEWDK